MILSAAIPALADAHRNATAAAAELRRFAARTDLAGFDLLLVGAPADALLAAGWLITTTQRIGLVPRLSATDTQPFHTARALAAMDTLSGGRMGWLPTAAPHAEDQAAEYIDATQALWDSWDADALIIDKHSAVYLDSAKIRRIDFRGRYYSVMGPLNAARPPQGYPVLVQEAGAGQDFKTWPAVDVVLIEASSLAAARTQVEALRAAHVKRIIVSSGCRLDGTAAASTPAAGLVAAGDAAGIARQLSEWQGILGCDGFHLVPDGVPEAAATVLESVARCLRSPGNDGGGARASLRTRLGLAVPHNRWSPS